jgi:heat shock protein HtpX
MHKVPSKELKHIEGYNAFFIIPAISGDTLTQLFSTHPPIEKRVQKLLDMESSMRRY